MGCVEPPKPDPTADWSEERKEYEANKLVKLIDDMIKLGAVTPGQVGPDGRVRPVEHVLQLQEGMKLQSSEIESDSD